MIKNLTSKYKYDIKILKNLLNQGNLKEFNSKFDISFKKYGETKDLLIFKSIKLTLNDELKKAKYILEKKYHLYKYDIDFNYNLGQIYYLLGNFKSSIIFFARAYILTDKKDKKNIYSMIQEDKNFANINFLETIKLEIQNIRYNPKNFPIDKNNKLLIGNSFNNKNKDYFVASYDYYLPERDGIFIDNVNGLEGFLKTETLAAMRTKSLEINSNNQKTIIPILKTSDNQRIYISNEDNTFTLDGNLHNRYYYYPIDEKSTKIYSNKEFIAGEKIILKNKKHIPKLVLNIFVDGLSQKIIEKYGMKKLMPNTYNFFKKGTMCNNVHVTGEWTYPNMASFFTGQYMINHGMIHPWFNSQLDSSLKTIMEVFKENDFFTAKIDGDWRSTPEYGYIRGVDRFLYQSAIRGMSAEDIIMESIEHIEAFNETNNFVWICFSDLHDVADGFEGRLSTQINNNLEDRFTNDEKNNTSVRTKYDERLERKYINQIKRLDVYMGTLFGYILNNFNDDDFIVSLISDHGQGYLVKPNEEFLSDNRTKVPFMFRGRGVQKGICTELIEGIDLIPILTKLSNIKDPESKERDSNLPVYFGGDNSRNFTYTESIFPGSTYKSVIKTNENEIYFETINNVSEDCLIELNEYNIKIKGLDKNIIIDHEKIFWDHIKYRIK